MKKFAIPIIIVIALTGAWYLSNTQTEEPSTMMVPELTLETHTGELVSINNLEGPLVINAWASWCTFCKQELKDFKELQEELGNQITFVAINRGESLQKANEFIQQQGVEESMLFLLDPEDSFYKSIDGFTMPETIFVNASGKISIHKRGFMRKNEVRDKINQII